MRAFSFVILTPTGCFFDGKVTSVVFPTEEGEIGLLYAREDCVIAVREGAFRYKTEKDEAVVAESLGGFAEMRGNVLTYCTSDVYDAADREIASKRREELLAREREEGERSLADYKLSKAAMAKAFDKLRRSRHNNK